MTGRSPKQSELREVLPIPDAPSDSSTAANETEDRDNAQSLSTGSLKDKKSEDRPTERAEKSVEGGATGKDGGDENGKPSAKVEGKGDEDDDEKEDEEEEDGDDEDEDEEEEEEDEDDDDNEEEEEEEEEEDDEEPLLKSTRLTQHLGAVYRNGDATSACLVAGDKMIVGTHNGNIHVIQLPGFNTLRVYHAHSASVTSISISPYPPPLPDEKAEMIQRAQTGLVGPPARPSESSPSAATKRMREIPQVPKIPSNDIYIATSSMDGNVCVQSLVDLKDVQLRNFARPVQAVALSPDYKSDRTYLSGGRAGQLILTVGGGPGRSTSTTVGTAAAVASDWLSTIGVKNSGGKDTVLHSGEGTINTIKWSLSGKYVAWLNEHGTKIMRSKLHLDNTEIEDAWKRIGHVDRPHTSEWETMAGVWKGRAEWIDEKSVESDESEDSHDAATASSPTVPSAKSFERLLVGWGGTMWIIHVHPGGIGHGKQAGEKTIARAEIAKILHIDCIISGISLYAQNQLLVLAFSSPEDEGDTAEDDTSGPSHSRDASKKHKSKHSTSSADIEQQHSQRQRLNALPPELRLIDLKSQAEVDRHSLSINRVDRLSAADYHMCLLPARNAASVVASTKSALEALAGIGSEMWNVAVNPRSLFSSGASIMSGGSGDDGASVYKAGSIAGTIRSSPIRTRVPTVHPTLSKPGVKIFLHSPYDCVLATKRDLSDHLTWLLEREQYRQAWELLDENPEILAESFDGINDPAMPPTPSKHPGGADDFFDDESVADTTQRNMYSAVEKEKRRVGELWIREVIDDGDWEMAGQVCGKVLTTPDRWEKWVWTFAGANKFDEITKHMPTKPMKPPLPTTIYEVLLGHYIQNNKPRFRELLDLWPTDLFDIPAITTTLENQLKYRDVRENSVEDGERGRDWKIVVESLAKLYEAGGRHRDALRCYIRLQDADSAFRLIGDYHLADAVADDIPAFIGLRVSPERLKYMDEHQLVAATAEAITLLVDEAQHGLVRPEVVVEQLQARNLQLYLFFYLRGLWKGQGIAEHTGENLERLILDSQSLVDNFADLAVRLFATYDRPLLMEFLKTSTSYGFEKAVQECEQHSYYDELVYLYSKTGQMKRALYLIIDRLNDVNKAIDFAKEQDDPDLWEDLLNYSMDKPSFIRALLEQVGTTINPITLVRRIPEGLEIQGLREGLIHMMKEHELQHSISWGVATVLRSEVATAQNELRTGQRKGIKFEVLSTDEGETAEDEKSEGVPKPGQCAKCLETFTEYEMEALMGFVCGHAFHVSHLLEMLHKGKQNDIDLGNGPEEGSRYSVGMKVMKARLLRDKVRGGCPICHPTEA
ncbi:vacuolar membrane protein Vps41-like protein [Trichoderma sp. SZMC 28011]